MLSFPSSIFSVAGLSSTSVIASAPVKVTEVGSPLMSTKLMVTSCPGVGLSGVEGERRLDLEGLGRRILRGGVGDGDIRHPIAVHVSRFETHRSIEHAVSSVVLDGRIDGNGERTVINICIDRVVAADHDVGSTIGEALTADGDLGAASAAGRADLDFAADGLPSFLFRHHRPRLCGMVLTLMS